MVFNELEGYDEFISKAEQKNRIYLNEYFRIIENSIQNSIRKSKDRPGAVDIHHIIPRSMGGQDLYQNLVELTFADHVLVHFYLFKAFRNEEMAYAFNLLSNRTSPDEFEKFTEDERNQLLSSLQDAKEVFGKRRQLMAKENWSGDKNPSKNKFGKDHHSFGRIVINKNGTNKRINSDQIHQFEKDGWQLGFTEGTYDYERDKKIYVYKDSRDTTISESDLSVFLTTGWKLGRHPDNTRQLAGKCRYATPDGKFFASLSRDDPRIEELGLIIHKTEASHAAVKASQLLAVQANTGTRVYTNGIIQKRFKENPGGEWILGELPISEEIKKKRGDACSVACKGTIVYNDGIRNYRLKPEDEPEPHWIKGMAPQKKRSSTKQKGLVVYNDGKRNYRIPPDQVPDPSWKRGMKPRM